MMNDQSKYKHNIINLFMTKYKIKYGLNEQATMTLTWMYLLQI